jgi:hypothetical protein
MESWYVSAFGRNESPLGIDGDAQGATDLMTYISRLDLPSLTQNQQTRTLHEWFSFLS